MIKVTGRSNSGYSEAIKDTLNELKKDGKKIHFFNVIEQRGTFVKDEIEFQVVIEVAVEP